MFSCEFCQIFKNTFYSEYLLETASVQLRKSHRLLRRIRKTKILSQLSKTPYFRLKWENRDINVAEQANIAKFSKPGDKGTPLRHFELFFDDALVDMIVGYTKSYGHIKKADSSFEITNETFRLS